MTQIDDESLLETAVLTNDQSMDGCVKFSPVHLRFLLWIVLFSASSLGCQKDTNENNEAQSENAHARNEKLREIASQTNTIVKKNVAQEDEIDENEVKIAGITDKTVRLELYRKVTESQLNRICSHENIEELILDGGGFGRNQMAQLLRLKKLEHLRIRNFPANDSDIKKLVQLKKLRIVNLPQADFTDESIRQLSQLPDLQLLRFSSSRVTDNGIIHLKNCRSLRALHLIRVPITNRSVASFCAIKPLESLYLDGSKLDDDGFSSILKQRPDIHLHIDQIHLDYDPNKHDHSE